MGFALRPSNQCPPVVMFRHLLQMNGTVDVVITPTAFGQASGTIGQFPQTHRTRFGVAVAPHWTVCGPCCPRLPLTGPNLLGVGQAEALEPIVNFLRRLTHDMQERTISH